MTTFCSWSGGKESTLAFYRCLKNGIKADYLVNMIPSEGSEIGHGLPPEFYKLQAESMGIEINQAETDWDGYEEKFSEIIGEMNPEVGIFGDVYIQDHRKWVEGEAKELGFKALEPLWGEGPKELCGEFLDLGFEGIIVMIDPDAISPEWLGKPLDLDFLEYLEDNGVCPIGENGEYHTASINGPIFEKGVSKWNSMIKENLEINWRLI